MKKVYLLCNAHIDPVWQWDTAEGKSVAVSTFASVCDLLDEYDFVFCHNESVLYEWVEDYDPILFERIKGFIASGKWKVMGGWYLQPDCNIPTTESIIRHALVGKEYFKEKFGLEQNTVAINLDSFGHSAGLPYVLNKLGFKGYIGHRPMECFVSLGYDFKWTGLGCGELKFFRPCSYNSEMGMAAKKIEAEMERAKDDDNVFVLWGVGNHGGGPSRQDLEDILKLKQKYKDIEFIHTYPEEYLDIMEDKPCNIVSGDLYPCFPGCYSSQIEVKKAHRQLENLFFSTEKLLSTADMLGVMEYPSKEMEKIQKILLFSQFHDILPGTTVRKVKEEALRQIGEGINRLSVLSSKAIYQMAKDCKKASPMEYSVFVFNPAPYAVTEFIENPILMAERFMSGFADLEVRDESGKVVSQVIKEDSNIPIEWAKKVAFEAKLEPMSLKRFDVKCIHRKEIPVMPIYENDIVIENNDRKIKIGMNTGLVESFVVDGVEMISGSAFLPVIYDDNEDPWAMQVYQQKRLGERQKPFTLATKEQAARICGHKTSKLPAVHIVEDGAVYTVVESILVADTSYIIMQYKVYKTCQKVTVDVELHFDHKDKMVKLEIPACGMAQVETQIMGGSEEVPSDGSERVCHKWVMLKSEENKKAIAILNDSIYGFSAKGNVMQLTLVRGAAYTAHFISEDRKILRDDRYNPRNDQGEHRYSFELMGGEYNNVRNTVDRVALSFNEKPFIQNIFPQGKADLKNAEINLSGDSRVIMTAFKKLANGGYVVRLVNMGCQTVKTHLKIENKVLTCMFNPFEIKSLTVDGSGITETDEIKI